MITTVTLNPCTDLTVKLEGLTAGQLNLALSSRSDVCGKGINVSVVLRSLGLSTMCTGISFDGGSDRLRAFLEEQCIAHNFAMAHGNIRTNIKLFDESTSQVTEINSKGDEVDASVLRDYLDKLVDCAHKSAVLVFSGRIPTGADSDIYRRSIEAVKKLDVLTMVDAEKEPLKQAVLGKPYLIKPNQTELEDAFNCKIHSVGDAVEASRDIIKTGVKVVCCTMGAEGAVITDKRTAWHAPALKLDIKGTVGAGDSAVAGICKAIREKLGVSDMLRYAVAAASASLLREGSLLCKRSDFERLLPQITVNQVKYSQLP